MRGSPSTLRDHVPPPASPEMTRADDPTPGQLCRSLTVTVTMRALDAPPLVRMMPCLTERAGLLSAGQFVYSADDGRGQATWF
jgi:hypothetical protein